MKYIIRLIGLCLFLAIASVAWAGQGVTTDPCATAISNAAQLKDALNGGHGSYYLTANINLSGQSWDWYDFYGTLDGRGYTISNLSYDARYNNCVGFVAVLEPCAVIENVILSNFTIYGAALVGTVAGVSFGILRNVQVTSSTVRSYYCISSAAELDFGNDDYGNPYPAVASNTGSYVGGFCGATSVGSLIEYCYINLCNIDAWTATNMKFQGGMVGYCSGNIYNSKAYQNNVNWSLAQTLASIDGITTLSMTGGIAGCQDNGSVIQNCIVAHPYSSYHILAFNYVAGLVCWQYAGCTLRACLVVRGTQSTVAAADFQTFAASAGQTVRRDIICYNRGGTVQSCHYENASSSSNYTGTGNGYVASSKLINNSSFSSTYYPTSSWNFKNTSYPAPKEIAAPTYNFSVATSSSCQSATLSLSGTPPTGDCVRYQWQRSANNSTWTNIDGATNATYTTSASETADVYYRCRVLLDGYSYLPTNTSVVVHPLPVITLPASYSICNGSGTTLAASATNASTYSWSPGTGLSSTSVAQPTASPTNTTPYTLTVVSANSCSANKSTTVTVNPVTAITAQPSNATVCYGGTDNLSVTATGTGTVTYAWKYSSDGGSSWSVASGTNNTATYAIPTTLAAGGSHKFKVVVHSDCGDDVTSNVVTVTVNPSTAISVQPSNATVCYGETDNLSLTATGTGTITYAWKYSSDGGANWSAATGINNTSTYAIPTNLSAGGSHKFKVVVHSDCGADVTSDVVTVTVNPLTAITAQPSNTSVCVGGTDNLNVTATGAGTVTYAWKYSSDGGSSWSAASGTNNTATYAIPTTLAAGGSHKFKVVVHSDCGDDVTSNVVTVTVNALPSVTINGGTGLTLYGASVELTAAGASTYVWSPSTELDDDDVAVVTATVSETRTYTVTGTDANSCENSATVTVVPAINVIVSGSTTFCYGDTRTLTVDDDNAWTDYAWYTNTTSDDIEDDVWGSSISSSRAYTTAANLAVGTHYFYCTSPTDGANTQVVTLVVTPITAITAQPSNTNVCLGATNNLNVTAEGTGTVTYAWKYSSDGGANWSAAAGANNAATYALPTNLALGDGHKYKVVVHSDCGADVTSDVVTVTVTPLTSITMQPADDEVCYGAGTTLRVIATGTGLGYQWQSYNAGTTSWEDIDGATNDTYNVPTSTAVGNHDYRVVVSSTCSADLTSDVATVIITSATTITVQPANAAICYSASPIDNLSVTAIGTGTLNYQWQKYNTATTTWENIASANSETYSLPANVAKGSTIQYRVIVGSDCGDDDTSDVVTVVQYPYINGQLTNSVTNQNATVYCLNEEATQLSLIIPSGCTLYWSESYGGTYTTDPLPTPVLDRVRSFNIYGYFVNTTTGCTTTKQAHVVKLKQVTALINGESAYETSIVSGNEVALTASGATTYLWSPSTELSGTSGASVTATPTTTRTYTVTATNAAEYGKTCSNTATASITVQYRITVVANNDSYGTVTGNNTIVADGGSATISASPAVGFHFVEWDEDGNTDNPRTITNIHANATYTANFEEGSWIVYDGNEETSGTAPIDANFYTLGSNVTMPNKGTLAKTDAVFLGWATRAFDVVEDIDVEETIAPYAPSSTYRITDNTIMYAVWAVDANGNGTPDYKEYTLTYNGNNQSAGVVPTDATVYTKGQNASVKGNIGSPALSRTHAVFLGWTTTQVNGLVNSSTWKNGLTIYEEDDALTINATTMLYAVWAADENDNSTPDYEEEFDVIFSAGSHGSLTGVTSYTDVPYGTIWGSDGANITVPTPVPATGYAFLHWEDESGDEVTEFPVTIKDDLSYTAIFTANTIHVTYNSNSASAGVVPVDALGYALGDDVILLANNGSPALTKDGATFIGWATSAQPVLTSLAAEITLRSSGNFYEVGGTYENIADNQTFYAVWARDINGHVGIADGTPDYKQYRVLYDKNGGKGETIDTNIYSAGTTDIPVKDNGNMYNPGYVFVGWSIDDNGGVPFADSTEMNTFEISYEIYRPVDNATVDIVSSNLTLYALWGVATKFPIELVEFRSDCADQGIALSWTTATETYNEYFTLFRSENGVDFYELARIAGAGTANDFLTYTYTDLTAEKETMYYYRLTQTDFDGISADMGTITALCERGTEKETELRIYPNPTRDMLNVEVYNTVPAKIEFVLYTVTGMEVRHYTEAVVEGKQTCVLNISNLEPGIYYLRQVGTTRLYKVAVVK